MLLESNPKASVLPNDGLTTGVSTAASPWVVRNAPSTRYYGSKRKLLSWLRDAFDSLEFQTVLDLFGGTASVSLLLKSMGKSVTYHDGLSFNADVGRAVLSHQPPFSEEWLCKFLIEVTPLEGVVSRNFANVFFLPDEDRWIDGFMHKNLHEVGTENERSYLRYLLYQACLKKRPYNLFHRANLNMRTRTDVSRTFGNLTTWNRSFAEHILHGFKELRRGLVPLGNDCEILASSSAEIINPGYDLVYLDPPYVSPNSSTNKDNYWKKYHFLEGMSQYETWEQRIIPDSPIKSIPEPAWMKAWSEKDSFPDLLLSLVKRHENSIVVLSYVPNAIPHHEEIEARFRDIFGECRVIRKSHRYALSSTDKDEILFVGVPLHAARS